MIIGIMIIGIMIIGIMIIDSMIIVCIRQIVNVLSIAIVSVPPLRGRLGGGCNDWQNKSLTKHSNLSLPLGKERVTQNTVISPLSFSPVGEMLVTPFMDKSLIMRYLQITII